MRSAARGEIAPTLAPGSSEAEPSLTFIEPNLAFSVAPTEVDVRLRVRFALEAAPPLSTAEQRLQIWRHWTELPIQAADLEEAATTLARGLAAFPERIVEEREDLEE